jgi:L-alanine-DL-glutamate epimerase-like enolase superfamily enzyme
VLTNYSISAGDPMTMAATAQRFSRARAIKLKLTGEPIDADRVPAVREARPEVLLSVDANQGFGRPFLEDIMPTLVSAQVTLTEQPFRVGEDALLDGLSSPIPIAADESVQVVAELAEVAQRVDVINIKLDKCGGLTEGIAMARACRINGVGAMVGCMLGTSLAMAPAYLLVQLCGVVDLDAPLLLKTDRDNAVQYNEGYLSCPSGLWGQPRARANWVN